MNKRSSVLVIGDDSEIIENLRSNLEALGYLATTSGFFDVLALDFTEYIPDLIIVDLTQCNYKSLSACDSLMAGNRIPEKTIVTALVSGQSMGQIPLDYEFSEIILYPFTIAELSFRLRRALHLYNGNGDDTLKIGNLSITPSRYEVKVNDKPVLLSHKEYELLKHLVTNRSHVFTREELFGTVWGSSGLGDSRTVDVHIRRVRMKIGDLDRQYIKTVRGVGYTFRFEKN